MISILSYIVGILLVLASSVFAYSIKESHESDYNDAFCLGIEGKRETRHPYFYPSGTSYIVVDCETDTAVYEGGLDKRSSLDSVQQALFFAYVTGKEPVVVIYDTDGRIGPYEHRIRIACEMAGVRYLRK